MHFPYFIAKRIIKESNSSFASVISKLAVVSVSVGLSSMILAFFILGGFQQTIKNKIYNFKGHLEITKYNLSHNLNQQSISTQSIFYQSKDTFSYIDHVQSFGHKAGLIKTKNDVEGIVFKGVGNEFDTLRFKLNMIQGRFIHFENNTYAKEVVLSDKIANKMNLKLGDKVMIHFVQNPPRFRQLTVVGLYETGLEEFDKNIILGDLGLIQRLNGWTKEQVGGFEIFINDELTISEAEETLYSQIDADLYVDKINDKYRQIFDWLALLDQNVTVFLGLILIVACFNMVSILLILILERIYMIGVLQALGASKGQIRKIFMFNGILLVGKGLFYGNFIAFIIAFLQNQFHIIPLDATNYYMDYVPILWDLHSLIILNILTFLVVTIAIGIPMTVVAHIKPVAAIRFS